MEKEQTIILQDGEKTGKPRDLFFMWFAANIGILGIVYGAIIVNYQLSFFQSILVALLGPLSFALVGYASLSGRDSGAPTFVMSRAAFGFKGNFIPALVGWFGQVGWLSVNVTTGTLVLLSIFNEFGIETSTPLKFIAWLIFAGLVLVSVSFSQETLVKAQAFFTYIFGGLTIVVLAFLIPNTDWNHLFALKSGSWISSFLPALMFVIIGTGLTWTKAASDYSRYQSRKNSSRSIIFNVTAGAFIPLFLIIGTGILLASKVDGLASAENPVALIGSVLPGWMTIIYLIAALGGITPMCFIGLKSSRLILASFNLKVKDSTAISIHAVLITIIPLYVLVVSNNFMGNFQTFLSYLGIGLAAWIAIYLIDYTFLRRRVGYNKQLLEDPSFNPFNTGGVIGWILGVGSALILRNFIESSYFIPITLLISGGYYYFSIQAKIKQMSEVKYEKD
ncbi:purine-cytosine permease family protein [Paenibacillus jiagnxiensis]|uniref:purine-cytosine permease family protein n=1 Tax=Paenibacillus jiagnxiensis TaxID=3228926 RepID=UPI0033B94C19